MSLTKEAIQLITNDSNLRAKIMLVDGKSEYTLKRWLKSNDDELTKPKYTDVISAHTGIPLKQLLDKPTTKRKAATA